MGMQSTKALRSERRWQDQRWTVLSPWGQGSAATCLMMMEKGPSTVDGACQGPRQSQGGASLTCAQGAVWVSESQATGPGQKSQQGDDDSSLEQLILGTEEVINLGNVGAVCQPTVPRPLSSLSSAIPRAIYGSLTLKKLLEREKSAAPLISLLVDTVLQRSPVDTLENCKALSQKTPTPLLQQGFSKARTEPERGFPVFP